LTTIIPSEETMKKPGQSKATDRSDYTRLEHLPNVGPAVAADLRLIGIAKPEDLVGRDPYRMYDQLCEVTKQRHDPCLLDTFIAAVRFMGGEEARPWWHYTKERKRVLAARQKEAGMTERQWRTSRDAKKLIEWAVGRASDRKLRLFAVAGCRAWPVDNHPGGLQAVGRVLLAAEALADGGAGEVDAVSAAIGARRDGVGSGLTALDGPADAAAREFTGAGLHGRARLIAALLREVVGNPFSPIALDPKWRTPPVLALSRAAYDARELPSGHLDPARLAVLSDALEEAGCTDESILSHLRSPGPHVRGCWALDLILGKK
jgi:hypothetical protein